MDISTSRIHARIVRQQQMDPNGPVKWADDLLRRLIDFVAALLGLIVLGPVFVGIAILIKRDSEGPAFYRGPRMGRGGEPFKILKFRTMYERPESYQGPKITGNGDPRITPIGQWLRDTKLNELPQLWNVLKGQMSLVGPRPEDPDIVDEWPEAMRRELLSVRPGITSPASVLYSDEEKLLQAGSVVSDYLGEILPSKLRLDLIYVRHRTILSDLDVIFYTLLSLVPQARKHQVSEHALYWGPLARFITRHFRWFLADLIAAALSVGVAVVIWFHGDPLIPWLLPSVAVAMVMALAFGGFNALRGLNRIYWSKAPSSAVIDLALSTVVATMITVTLNGLGWFAKVFPNGLLLTAAVLAFFDFVAMRYRSRLVTGLATRWINWRGQPHTMGERVLIVGAGEGGSFATWLLHSGELTQAFNVVGMVDDAPEKQGVRVSGVPILGCTTDIPHLVAKHDVGVLIFSISRIEPAEREHILEICHGTGVRVVLLPAVMETVRGHFSGELAADSPMAETANGLERTGIREMEEWLAKLDRLIDDQAWEAAAGEVRKMREEFAGQAAPPQHTSFPGSSMRPAAQGD